LKQTVRSMTFALHRQNEVYKIPNYVNEETNTNNPQYIGATLKKKTEREILPRRLSPNRIIKTPHSH